MEEETGDKAVRVTGIRSLKQLTVKFDVGEERREEKPAEGCAGFRAEPHSRLALLLPVSLALQIPFLPLESPCLLLFQEQVQMFLFPPWPPASSP